MSNYDSGEVLGAQLEELVRAANAELPIVEDAFHRVHSKIQDSIYMVSTAFLRPDEFGGGGGDKHTLAVQNFAEILATCVKQSQESIALTADALRLAAQEYARTDSAAGAELQNLMRDDHTVDSSGKIHAIPDLPL